MTHFLLVLLNSVSQK